MDIFGGERKFLYAYFYITFLAREFSKDKHNDGFLYIAQTSKQRRCYSWDADYR